MDFDTADQDFERLRGILYDIQKHLIQNMKDMLLEEEDSSVMENYNQNNIEDI